VDPHARGRFLRVADGSSVTTKSHLPSRRRFTLAGFSVVFAAPGGDQHARFPKGPPSPVTPSASSQQDILAREHSNPFVLRLSELNTSSTNCSAAISSLLEDINWQAVPAGSVANDPKRTLSVCQRAAGSAPNSGQFSGRRHVSTVPISEVRGPFHGAAGGCSLCLLSCQRECAEVPTVNGGVDADGRRTALLTI
jgi:hypothetical protein